MSDSQRPLKKRNALVTGATSGIGLGIARALAEQGCDLTLSGFGEHDAILALCKELSDDCDVEVVHIAADLREPATAEALVESAARCCGGVDILVNNAGIQHVAPIDEFPPEKWNDILAVNLTAAFHTIRACVPGMRERGWGRIINVASAHALRASPFKAAYVSAKHGLAGLTKTVALEVAEQGVTVNAIAPGYVDTPLVSGQIDDTARARGISREEVLRDVVLQAQPTRKLIGIEQVAALAAFLCTDAAAPITGAVLPIDGGWTAK